MANIEINLSSNIVKQLNAADLQASTLADDFSLFFPGRLQFFG